MNRLTKNSIVIVFFTVLITSFVSIVIDLIPYRDNKKVYRVSCITSSSRDENLSFFIEGISRASKDMNVEVMINKLVENEELESQIMLLKKELKNNIDAILISPIDYEKLSKPIEYANDSIPVILINSKIKSNKNIPYLSSNNYNIGVDLAEEVVRRGNTRNNILVINNNFNSSNLKEMQEGFINELKTSKNSFVELRLKDNEVSYYNQILSSIDENNFEVLVSFNENIIKILADIKKDMSYRNSKFDFQLYGVSSANEMVSYIEEGVIDALAVQNEFNIGYLGVQMAMKKISNEKIDNIEIMHSIINKENMYLEKNQKLIFPFIK